MSLELVRLSCSCVGVVLGPDPEDTDLIRVLVFLYCDGAARERENLDVFERKIPREKLAESQTLAHEEAQPYLNKLIALVILGNQTLQIRALSQRAEEVAWKYEAGQPTS